MTDNFDTQVAMAKMLLALKTADVMEDVGQMVPQAAFFVASIEHSVGLVAATLLAAMEASEKIGPNDPEHHHIVESMERTIDKLPEEVRKMMTRLEQVSSKAKAKGLDTNDLTLTAQFPTDAPSE